MEGMSSDQMEAAIMMPAANPKKSVFTFSDISFRKKNTKDAPSVVAAKINKKPITVIQTGSIVNSFYTPGNLCVGTARP